MNLEAQAPYVVLPAAAGDAAAVAALHVESWREAYRGLVPDSFLDGPVVDDRQRLWRARLGSDDGARRLVLKAVGAADLALVGFVCVLLDAEPQWGPLLDNLHVKPALRGRGIGRDLLTRARAWVADAAPGRAMHLWVIEGNEPARRFYERVGGCPAERGLNELTGGIRVPVVRYVWPPLR